MRIFRLINNGWIGNFVIIGNKVYVLLSDPITALKLYSEGKDVPLGPEVNINIDELLTKDYTYKGLRFTKPYDPPEVWGGSGIVYEVARARYSEEDVAMIRVRPYTNSSTMPRDQKYSLKVRQTDASAMASQ